MMKNPNRLFKDAIYEQFARIGKAVSSPKRLELLDLLCQGPRTVEVLAKESGLTLANASQHLQVLRERGLVCNLSPRGSNRLRILPHHARAR
jgi:DNA-binding transcriptional ArsR family regulator